MFNIEVKWDPNAECRIMAEARESLKREVERAVRSVRCLTHGQVPSVTFSPSGDWFTAEITGCCDAAVKRAEAAIR
jgi:hypothetical protein